ncbi:MAG: hypothetical protein NUV74_16465 [Candidatus Brocadiaceae bacterium]|nr:hypothetical protein [Candidatus Brocadiaceae bacterium]
MKMFKKIRKTHKLVGILIIFGSISCLFLGCAGTRGAGALSDSHWATGFTIHINIQVAWDTLLKVLKDDPTLFQVNYNKIMRPTDGKEGKIQGKKGMSLITIFVIPQGKDNTTINVQAADVLGFVTDESVQGDLTRAIRFQMVDIVSSLKRSEIHKEYERFLARDEVKKQQSLSSTITKQESPVDTALHSEIHKDFEKKDWNTVVKKCKKSLETDPEDFFACGNLGGAYAMLNEFDLSIEYSTKASKLRPELPGSYIQMVYAYARKGDKDQAFDALQKAVDRGYKDIDYLRNDTDLPDDFRKDTRLNNY